MTKCESCVFYQYDENYDDYVCDMDLDEVRFFVLCFLQRSSQAIVLSGIIFPNQLVIFGIHHARHIVRIKLFPLLGHLANFIGQAHNFTLRPVDGILHILDFLQFFQNLPFIAQLDNEHACNTGS